MEKQKAGGRKRKRSRKVKQLSAPLPKKDAKEEAKMSEDEAEEVEAVTPAKNQNQPDTVTPEEDNEQEKQDAERKEEEKQDAEEEEEDPPAKKLKIPEEFKDQLEFKNRQRVLVFCTRGITHKERLLMLDIRRYVQSPTTQNCNDLYSMLPHAKKEGKFDAKNKISEITEICEMKNCNNCIFFETRKRKDLYLWMCKTPNGPGCRFLVTNSKFYHIHDVLLTCTTQLFQWRNID